MDYLNKLRSTVSSVAASVSSALPGNPVTREYDVGGQLASAGVGLCWKIFDGRKRSTAQKVSVWVFEKRDVDKWPKYERELFAELLKKGIAQLTRLRHPRLLVIEHPLEESRDSLAFCTEPIFASLSNALGRIDNMPSIIPPHLTDFQLLDVEIRHGLWQLSEALAFLHIDARMLHRNVCPSSVLINERGAWKLGGFDFAVASVAAANEAPSFAPLEWSADVMPCVQPTLDYIAPEHLLTNSCEPASDMFSLGVLSVAVFAKGRTPMDSCGNLQTYKRNAAQLKALPAKALQHVPTDFRDDVKMCLHYTAALRPDATQFSKVAHFDDPLVKTLNYFESLCQMDNAQKAEFFKGLPQVLARFPKRPLLQKILPFLTGEFATPDLIPFILPSIFHLIEQTTQAEFAAHVLPHMVPVFTMERPYQIALLLLQKMELLLAKTPESDVQKHILPLIYNALDSDTAKIQELCLNIIPNISRLVEREAMKNQLLPKLLHLGVDASVLSVKVNSLLCIGKILVSLEAWMVTDQILPALPKIASKEPGVLMAILGIYKLAFSNERLGISKEMCARSCLPYLMASSVENSLNLSQFEAFVALIRLMLAKVEDEQRTRLKQLSAMQEDQRSVQDFNEILSKSNARNSLSPDLQDLAANGVAAPSPAAGRAGKRAPMSLEEKKRLAAAQQHPASTAAASPPPKPPAAPLTATRPAATGANAAPLDLTAFLGAPPPRPVNPLRSTAPSTGLSATPKPMQPTMSSAPTYRLSVARPPIASQTTSSGGGGQQVDLSAFDSLVCFPKPPPAGMAQQRAKPSSAASNANNDWSNWPS